MLNYNCLGNHWCVSYLFKVFCCRTMMCQIERVFRIYLFDRIVELCEVAVETNNTLFWGASFGLHFPLLRTAETPGQDEHQT